ncbi:hypothetical protein AB0D04_36745 [Streptomyces sp. NPDC048483]|uniref:hypothetical protein n=1 Tax=Streptomyces sp. NPDC048483 TaxID=3154927 RepID=UPI00343337F8
MDGTTERLAEQVIESWPAFHRATASAECDAAVLDCAARLAADPGGEHACLWVYGLAEMAGYLTGRPGAAAEVGQRAVDALLAAHHALSGLPCEHETHPYEQDLERMEDDDIWYEVPDVLLLSNGEAEDEEWHKEAPKELYLCPRNVAAYAHVTADIIAPGSVPVTGREDGCALSDLLPGDQRDTLRHLSQTLNDYPTGSPDDDLLGAALVPGHLTKGVRAGYLVTLCVCSWYAVSGRIQEQSVLDEMIQGVETVLQGIADEPCTHKGGEHPSLGGDPDRDDGPDVDIESGTALRSPGGRADLQRSHAAGFGPSLEAWTCPAFLRALAKETLDTLAEGPGDPCPW